MEISGTKLEKSMDSKAGSLWKSVILRNLEPAWLGKKEKTQITNIRKERGNIITDIKRIIKYYQQHYANSDDQIWERHKQPHLTVKQINDLSGPVSIKEIESVVKNLSQRKLLAQIST